MQDAAGLVIAGGHSYARAYAGVLTRLTGTRPVVVLSDDPAASRKIAAFATSEQRWMIAVRKVSEGVDIPRLAVGVYATPAGTALFFAQAVGRFVRARRRGETASVFVPSMPVLLGYAAELEAERDHVLRRPDDASEDELELEQARRRLDTADRLSTAPFQPLAASAQFDRVLYDGSEFGVSAEDEDFLGLPGLLEPEQVAVLLRKRHAEQASRRLAGQVQSGEAQSGQPESGPGTGSGPGPATSRQTLAALRTELNGLVRSWHHRTGQPHGVIHSELRRTCGGPPVPQATAEQLRTRLTTIRRWSAKGT